MAFSDKLGFTVIKERKVLKWKGRNGCIYNFRKRVMGMEEHVTKNKKELQYGKEKIQK